MAKTSTGKRVKQITTWAPIAAGLCFLLLLAYGQRERILKAQNDFTAFYIAAHLAGTPDLYSRPVNLAFVQALHGFTIDTVVYIRPPFYAALLKPLATLPYRTAFLVYSAASFSCLLWFVVRFTREVPSLPYFVVFSIPAMATLGNGQDTLFLLAVLGASTLLERRNRHFAAGLVLSLCAVKFHLFVLVPVALLLRRQWKTIHGGLCGTAILTAIGMIGTGPSSILQWIEVLRDPRINASATVMPNIHGLVATVGTGQWLEIPLLLCVCGAFGWIAVRSINNEFVMAASLVTGLLVSYHSGAADDVLLFAVLALVCASSASVPLRACAALLVTPIPYLLLYAGPPYSAVLPLMMLLFLGLCVLKMPQRPNIKADLGCTPKHNAQQAA